jgi:hypothetical protein
MWRQQGLAARVRDDIKAIGARRRREWLTGLEGLSRRELRVVNLAAEGRPIEKSYQLLVTLTAIEGHRPVHTRSSTSNGERLPEIAGTGADRNLGTGILARRLPARRWRSSTARPLLDTPT